MKTLKEFVEENYFGDLLIFLKDVASHILYTIDYSNVVNPIISRSEGRILISFDIPIDAWFAQ